MNFTKTTSYSLKILDFMANNSERIMSASYLYRSLDIPYSYLRQILSDLSADGFIKSTKGRNGGFILKKNIKDIYLIDIINATEGTDSFDRCIMGFTKCPFKKKCPMHECWSRARADILNVLKNTSLAEIIITHE